MHFLQKAHEGKPGKSTTNIHWTVWIRNQRKHVTDQILPSTSHKQRWILPKAEWWLQLWCWCVCNNWNYVPWISFRKRRVLVGWFVFQSKHAHALLWKQWQVFGYYMPVTLMKKVPFHDNARRGRKEREKDYLCLLREQWFILLDRMDEFQFVGGPWMLDKNSKPNVAYASNLDVLAWPCGKKNSVKGNKRESCSCSSEGLTRSSNHATVHQCCMYCGLDHSDQTFAQTWLMDLTTPSSVLQTKNTNDNSDFLLQDTPDEEHEVGGIKLVNGKAEN